MDNRTCMQLGPGRPFIIVLLINATNTRSLVGCAGFLVCSMARINLAAGSTLLPAIQAQGSDIKIAVPAGDVIVSKREGGGAYMFCYCYPTY